MQTMFRGFGIIGIVLALIGLLLSCNAVRKFEKAANDAGAVVSELRTKVERIDTNKDGKWSIDEILLFLGVPAGGLALLFRNFISDRRKAKIEARLENLGTDSDSD